MGYWLSFVWQDWQMKIITDPHCTEYSKAGHPEVPARISRTLDKLRAQQTLSLSWGKPLPVDEPPLLRAHTAQSLERLSFSPDHEDLPDLVLSYLCGLAGK